MVGSQQLCWFNQNRGWYSLDENGTVWMRTAGTVWMRTAGTVWMRMVQF